MNSLKSKAIKLKIFLICSGLLIVLVIITITYKFSTIKDYTNTYYLNQNYLGQKYYQLTKGNSGVKITIPEINQQIDLLEKELQTL